MNAVRKLNKKFVWAVTAAVAVGLLALYCANPVDKPPLQWRSKVDLPVTNDKFLLGQEMPRMLENLKKEQIDLLMTGLSRADTGIKYDTVDPKVLVKDTIKGDTVVFSILRKDSISYDTHEDSMKTKLFHPVIGTINVANMDTIKYAIPLPSGAGSFSVPVSIPTPKIYQVTFDSTSPPLSVSIKNTSDTVPVTGLSLTMLGTTQTLTTALDPNTTQTLLFPTARQGIAGSISVTAAGNAGAGTKGLEIALNCNGLIASFLKADDHVVQFEKQFTNDYELTDTLNVEYIDIQEGAFNYTLRNYTNIPLLTRVEQLHLWKYSYCALNKYTKFADLSGVSQTDTNVNYFGFLTNGFTEVQQASTWQILKSNLSSCRLFPLWNPTLNGGKGKSVSRVTYTVKNPKPRGDTLTISAGDSCLFTISAPGFKFKEMYGTVMQAYQRAGDTAKVQVPFPFTKASKDSLKNNFFLKKVLADIFMVPNLPDSSLNTPRRAYIDTLGVIYTLFNPKNPLVRTTQSRKFLNVYNKKVFRQEADMTAILNQWPDSMFITVNVFIPVGTKLRAINDLEESDPDYKKYMGRMKIKATNTVRMNAVLNWEVRNPTLLDLGSSKFVTSKALQIFNKLADKSLSFSMNAKNQTNVFMNLYSLVAPNNLRKKLDSMSVDSAWMLINNPALAKSKGYVSLFGNTGVRIPARGTSDSNRITLDDWQINQILGSDTCGWRWQARFLPFSTPHPDSLRDTDYVDIRSWMSLEGTNNMDSLLIWKDSTDDR